VPKKNPIPTDLSVEQLQEQLAQMQVEKEALEQAIEARRAAELTELASSIREQISERGYAVDQVVALLTKGRRKAAGVRRSGGYTRYVDPDNPGNEYSRGPLPVWLRDKMAAAGYDANDKAQREEFKASYLQQVA
jgi:DNA-binding protein H-NS